MTEQIVDGRGQGKLLGITETNRMLGDVIQQRIETERADNGKLFSVGTGRLTLPTNFDGPVLWFRNDSTTENLYIVRLIFGWNGGTSSRNTECFSLITYGAGIPTTNITSIDFSNENQTSPLVAEETALKWDGTGTAGMTGQSPAGTPAVPNTISIGNTSLDIHGNIVLGPQDTMQFSATPAEAGLYHVAVIAYYKKSGTPGTEEV